MIRGLLVTALAGVWLGGCGDSNGGADAASGTPDGAIAPDAPAAADAGVPDALPAPRLSTLVCELTERPGPVPQPPMTQVADFGAPVRLTLADPCSQDAIEVTPDGNRIYHTYSVNDLNLLIAEGRQVVGTEVRFQDRGPGDTWGPPYVLDLRRGDPDALAGETRVAPDGSWVIWHALSAMNYGYLDGLPAGQTFDLDLFEAPMLNGVPGPGVHLGREVNSAYLEGEHWATADGRTLYLTSNRLGGAGGTDLWRISRDAGGIWGAAELLPAPVNSAADELQPTISPDGAFLYFVSDRGGAAAIWRTPIDGDGSFGPGAETVISPYVGEPSFADDGRLFFVHVEIDFAAMPPEIYDADIYVVAPQ